MKRILFTALFLAVGLSGVLFFTQANASVMTGKSAPDFTLTDSNGKSHSLSDFKGQHVVLEWINHDCPFVKKHYKSGNMQSLQKEFTDKGVVWLSVASSAQGKQGHYDGAAWNLMTADKKASPTAVLLDANGKVGKLYGAQTTPHMYVIDPEGKLIYQGAIDDNPSADPADIEGSENYVRSALVAALSGQPVESGSTKAYGCSVKYAS
jgi:peroxiredoxin